MSKLFILSTVFVFLFSNCKKNNTSASYTPSCSGTQSYSINVAPLIQNYCVSCHSNYASFNQVKLSSASIRNSIVSGSMPRGALLTTDQKNSIVCWIDAGALNN